MNIYEKLSAVQSELIAPKKQYNIFGKFNYRSCEDIIEAVKPILKKHGLVLYISDSLEYIGNQYYIKSTAVVVDIAEPKSEISVQSYAREDIRKGMDASQATGSTSSYARKYALNGLFAIDDIKDSDTNENKTECDAKDAKREKIVCEFINETKRTGVKIDYFLKVGGVDKLEDLRTVDMEAAIKAMSKKPSKGV